MPQGAVVSWKACCTSVPGEVCWTSVPGEAGAKAPRLVTVSCLWTLRGGEASQHWRWNKKKQMYKSLSLSLSLHLCICNGNLCINCKIKWSTAKARFMSHYISCPLSPHLCLGCFHLYLYSSVIIPDADHGSDLGSYPNLFHVPQLISMLSLYWRDTKSLISSDRSSLLHFTLL